MPTNEDTVPPLPTPPTPPPSVVSSEDVNCPMLSDQEILNSWTEVTPVNER